LIANSSKEHNILFNITDEIVGFGKTYDQALEDLEANFLAKYAITFEMLKNNYSTKTSKPSFFGKVIQLFLN
jgi:hypothetical protein